MTRDFVFASAAFASDLSEELQSDLCRDLGTLPVRTGVRGRQAFAGGTVDLWPIEVADLLADEVVFAKTLPLEYFTNTLASRLVEYDQNKRKKFINWMPVAYRLDLTDLEQVMGAVSFCPRQKWVHDKSKVQAVPLGECEDSRHYMIPRSLRV